MKHTHLPQQQGLYDPRFEHDSCGVGFVCNIKGIKSNDIIKQGLNVLCRLSHRGAVGADPKTGDGAGILIQMPHKFFRKAAKDIGIRLPPHGSYGTGLIFLPQDNRERAFCKEAFENTVKSEGQSVLGWRPVPVDNSGIGQGARSAEPVFEQVFIEKSGQIADTLEFERRLYIIRRQVEKAVGASDIKQKKYFYITNISCRTFSYKGLLMPGQLDSFFMDLKDPDIFSALCLVHSRYSTNTFPTWDLAQPFRFLAHNGEINTLQGNINWIKARERTLACELFGADIDKLKPVVVESGSDSATIDNVFELLVLAGRSMEHAMMMLIPASWEHDSLMNEKLRQFYRYHACFMEPWDGPAAIAFTDGRYIGSILDRNGLRPARYLVTKDDFVVMASEVGVLDIDPARIKTSGRLEPGKIFFVDTESGRIVHDSEIKEKVSGQAPYGEWNSKEMMDLASLAGVEEPKRIDDIIPELKAFGYSREDLKGIIKPMAQEGKEPVGSMGNDTPHAPLSNRPQLLYSYFKQLFAQVTNPPIDSIREKLVMSLESFMGLEKNILEETPEHCHKIRVENPILTDAETESLRNISINGFKSKTIYTYFDASGGKEAFRLTLERICFEAEYAIEKGASFIILSDRGADKDNIAIPALLATSAVHHYLVRKTIRSQVAIITESAEPREVHHMALLFGYGADCVNPYLAHEAIRYLVKLGEIRNNTREALRNYNKALTDGILKVLSKMGISTLRSYRGAQIFEALGLNDGCIGQYFTGTVSRIGGVGIDGIAEETIARHTEAYYARTGGAILTSGGIYQWKRDGEFHLWNPDSIAALQDAVRSNDCERYLQFAAMINDQSKNPTTLRGLLMFKKAEPISIDEVESADSIMKRFATGAMSFGSISALAHETIAIAMNRIGGKSNTGEGGEDPNRFVTLPNGDSKRSSIKQVASGRFGVTINYLVNADEIQIKISQGAKPGEGGQLPGHKVNEVIARTRHTTPGVTLISPPPHHDIYSIEDLAQLIFDLKNANPDARISVKLVSEIGVGTVAAGVAKGRADMILISGGDGGTGASPQSSIRYAGLPWELGLSETHQTLVLNGLRSRVRLQTDGQMRTGRDVAIAAMLGAEEFGFCTAVLVASGCVMLRHCHLNNCSVGVATQDDILQKRFKGRPEYIVNYFRFVAMELRSIMGGLGIRTMDEMVGRTDLLHMNNDLVPKKASGLDYSKILYQPAVENASSRYCTMRQPGMLDSVLDRRIIKACADTFESKTPVELIFDINNSDRATGAMLSGEVIRRCGEDVLLEDTIKCAFRGTAGQSFGAFLAKGITFTLEGIANDYVGKGLSGGKLIIRPDRHAHYAGEENVIIGNTAFYGATSGEAYIRGTAGERFCVRNSGLLGVVEGVGEHGCEYMTGGRIIVLGHAGRNFAAGMSGGIAYVYDEGGSFAAKCNTDMSELESADERDMETIYNLLHNHFKYTGSTKAKKIMDNLRAEMKKFVKVMPIEYKRILEGVEIEAKLDLAEASDG